MRRATPHQEALQDLGGTQAVNSVICFSCPVCGRRKDYPASHLTEGVRLKCPFCGLELILRGCMWEEIRKEKERLGAKPEAPRSWRE